ncbi:MAG TPA: MFS transporter [Spongiibacteraceae bacterium]|nr:MFS transporter [Spongiibacteraceae bacterium]
MKWPEPQRTATARRMLICVVTGFSSGLPLFLLLNLVPAWLRSAEVDLKAIGLLAIVQLPYTWKFLWSPLVDRFALGRLGRRRSWMLATQIGLLGVIAWLGSATTAGLVAPEVEWHVLVAGWLSYPAFDWPAWVAFSSHPVTVLAFATVLCSATQDIALDAYRRELLLEEELGLGNSIHVTTYRVSQLIPGSLSLILSDHLSWPLVFMITALFMLPGLVLTLLISEPENSELAPTTLRAAAIEPLREFINRSGWRQAAWILAFMFFYKLGDSLCTALATPFYLDLGYSKTEIGVVAKYAGLGASIGGGLLGGLWMLRLGISRALWVFGVIQMVSILGFAWLAASGGAGGHDGIAADAMLRWVRLAGVVGLEAFGVGVGTAAFVAFIATQTNPAYTATQLALFTSFMAIPRSLVNASAGYLIDALGWTQFYLLCFALAVPGMLMLLKVAPWSSAKSD